MSFFAAKMEILYYIDLLGTVVFAISGALTASAKKLDFFGISAVAFITALGGGTLRDVLLGSTPVGWISQVDYLLMIVLGITTALLFRKYVQKLRRTFFLFDTIGISVFTILGLQKALSAGVSPLICIMMGMISAVFGGVIRDIVCNEIPLIFRKEFYAVTCILGGCLYFILLKVGIVGELNVIISCSSIVVIRIFAVRYKWRMPSV